MKYQRTGLGINSLTPQLFSYLCPHLRPAATGVPTAAGGRLEHGWEYRTLIKSQLFVKNLKFFLFKISQIYHVFNSRLL
jgi:hypothetical protein